MTLWYEYTGLRSEDGLAGSWTSVIDPLHREQILGIWHDALGKGASFEIEMPLRRALDGMYRWFIVRGQPLKNEQGNVEQWFGIAMDIHERKQSEQALRKSEERLQLALKAAHMIAWEFNPQSGATTRSENSLALLGIRPGIDGTFMTGIHPDDHQKVEGFLEKSSRMEPAPSNAAMCCPAERHDGCAPVASRLALIASWVSPSISASRRRRRQEIWRSANHDALTGLPNRTLFQHRLECRS